MLMFVLIPAKIVHKTLMRFMYVSEHKQQRTVGNLVNGGMYGLRPTTLALVYGTGQFIFQ